MIYISFTTGVTSLDTNIPHEDRLQVIKNVIPDKKTTYFPIKLPCFVFTNNYFRFGDYIPLHMNGCTMGTYMALVCQHIYDRP